ncbi:MAG: hypothetical protein GYB42_00710 [Alphaproteobacteria bacterium]|nr:hypothetical protein [Alphaproteobacteria bacterium]
MPEPDKQVMVGYGSFDLTRDVLIKAVSASAYVTGETFTAADVYIGSQVGWGLEFGTIPPNPELEAYSERVRGREAYHRAVAKDDALVPQQTDS